MISVFRQGAFTRRIGTLAALAFGLSSAAALDIGTRSLLVAEAAPMKSLTLAPTRASFTRFAVRVGGVAFTTTASSGDGSRIVGIRYEPSAPDGSRLVLDLLGANGKQVAVALPAKDWVALPIAKFVDTGAHGAVTLFGSLKDSAEEANYRRASKAMIANYHPAVQDNLLGLRLLQADMMLIEDQTDDIFKDDGRYLLGAGETAPTAAVLKSNAERRAKVESWQEAQPERFESYVVGDIGSKITFALQGGKLVLAGHPTWACWRRDSKAIMAATNEMTRGLSADAYLGYFSIDDFRDRAFQAASDSVPHVSPSDPIARLQRMLSVRRAAMEGLARQAIQRTGQGRPPPTSFSPAELKAALAAGDKQMVSRILSDAIDKVDSLLGGGTPQGKAIEKEILGVVAGIEAHIEALDVIQMEQYSSALSKLMKEQRGINPIVYDALTTAIQVAAVLRAAKDADPPGYAKFMTSMAGLKSSGVDRPAGYKLRTPTVYPRK